MLQGIIDEVGECPLEEGVGEELDPVDIDAELHPAEAEPAPGPPDHLPQVLPGGGMNPDLLVFPGELDLVLDGTGGVLDGADNTRRPVRPGLLSEEIGAPEDDHELVPDIVTGDG